jgi:indole-3-glycerol phosphate synthase
MADNITVDGPTVGGDVLAQICQTKREEVERRKAGLAIETLRQGAAAQADPPRGFGAALKERTAQGCFALIAEIKKASPSGGLIREEFEPAALAKAYEAGGATCISVLTDEPHFQGRDRDLMVARKATTLPVLRKDFILDPWQVYESRAMGADCILLIMAALSDEQARDLEEVARSLDMDVLAEVHDRRELDRALGLQTQLIGVNNRNLKTLNTDLAITEQLAPLVPPDRFLISESGIRNHEDMRRIAGAGSLCFLVGESLMRQSDVAAAVRTLLGAGTIGAARV